MPNMNGYQATRKIRRNGIETAIIAVTAYAMAGDDQKCLDAGCNDYIAKPINRNALLDLIAKYINMNEEISDNKTSTSSIINQFNSSDTTPKQAQSHSNMTNETILDWT